MFETWVRAVRPLICSSAAISLLLLPAPKRRLARLAERVARVSFAGLLMNQLYGAQEARLSEIAAEAAAIA